MNQKTVLQMVRERQEKGSSYRTLAKKYKVSASHIHRIMKKDERLPALKPAAELPEENLPDDIASLKAELRKAKLNITLLNNVIDIASEELGIDIRKKSGTRQS
jgi:Mor family transcriptional regulator